jgi:positive regulator of sigma E activity
MIEVIGVILAVLVVSSFVMLAVFALAGTAASVMTLRRAQRERRLADELDEMLIEIVGPRTHSLT